MKNSKSHFALSNFVQLQCDHNLFCDNNTHVETRYRRRNEVPIVLLNSTTPAHNLTHHRHVKPDSASQNIQLTISSHFISSKISRYLQQQAMLNCRKRQPMHMLPKFPFPSKPNPGFSILSTPTPPSIPII